MTARVGITAAELETLAAESGLSRFAVVDDSRRVPGYLHVMDALDVLPRDEPFPFSGMLAIAQVRAYTPMDEVLSAMCRSRTHSGRRA